MRSIAIAATAAMLFLTAATAAFAATTEYDFTVPIDVKGGSNGNSLAKVSVTVACAVGGASLGYSTATGDAANTTGENRTTVTNVQGKVAELIGQAKLVVTDTSGVATNYLCFAKLSTGTTPVNFISGKITPGGGTTVDSWNAK
jgi:hypothetical protein